MIADEALGVIRGMARAGRIFISGHARKRMRQRQVEFRDISDALTYATTCKAQADGSWKTSGLDASRDELVVVVKIEDELVVVTLF